MNRIPTATLLASYTHQDAQEQQAFEALAKKLSARLEQPVIPCPLDGPGNPLLNGITMALQQGAVKIVTLPLFLSPAEYQDNAVAKAITFASRRWPFVQFHLSPPPDWSDWVRVCSTLTGFQTLSGFDQKEAVVILTGRGETDPDINSDVSKLARLLYEAGDFGSVDVAFVANTSPTIKNQLNRYQALGAKQIIITPYFLFEGQTSQQLHSQAAQSKIDNCETRITPCLSSADTLINVLLAQHTAALEDRSLLPLSWEEVERQLTAELNSHDRVRPGQPAPDEDAFQRLAAKIDAILPPRYKGRTNEVSAAPMAAADLVFDDDGDVAWDQIFGVDDPNNPFCELALAGGPSHRGELLEPPLAAACEIEPGKYAAVLAEIERGIQMITGLPIVQSKSPGWIGVQCNSEEMAIWLVRAIIVENVMVRREKDVIYLPAGPHFTLKSEIKSIVTVTAKTWHYWIEHIAQRDLDRTARVPANEIATPETV
jgi:sirohydrochlorin cobaltochelatase